MKINNITKICFKNFLILMSFVCLLSSCDGNGGNGETSNKSTDSVSLSSNKPNDKIETQKPPTEVKKIDDKSVYSAFYSPKNHKCKIFKNKEKLYEFSCGKIVNKICAKNGDVYVAETAYSDDENPENATKTAIFCNGKKLYDCPENFALTDFCCDNENNIFSVGNIINKNADNKMVVVLKNNQISDTICNEKDFCNSLIHTFNNDVFVICGKGEDDDCESKIYKNNKFLYKILGNVYNLYPLGNKIYSIAYVFDDDAQMPVGQLFENDQPIIYFADGQRTEGYIKIDGQNYTPVHDDFSIYNNDIFVETLDFLDNGMTLTSLWKNGKRLSTFRGDTEALPEEGFFITSCLSMCNGGSDVYRVCVVNDMEFTFSTFYLLKNNEIFHEFVGLEDYYCSGVAWGGF